MAAFGCGLRRGDVAAEEKRRRKRGRIRRGREGLGRRKLWKESFDVFMVERAMEILGFGISMEFSLPEFWNGGSEMVPLERAALLLELDKRMQREEELGC